MSNDLFPTDAEGLAEAVRTSVVRLGDGDHLDLSIGPVRKRLGDNEVRMLAYNGSVPGPTLHVDQGSVLTVEVRNEGDTDATVHWHGLRVENRYDGVPFETQPPIPIGGTYTQVLRFPDAGVYWYHPHIREDYGIELGLYGTVVVEPSDSSYWPPADRFLALTLDDVLLEDGKIAPFLRSGSTFAAMGRFGNVMLVNGETRLSHQAMVGEVVRLYIVNTANTRIFKFGVRGARMKLVGGDSGRCEHESFVEDVLLSPSERAVVDVLFDAAGEARLEHRTPNHVYDLGVFAVGGTSNSDSASSFGTLRTDPELASLRVQLADDLERMPDKVLAFWAEMPLLHGDDDGMSADEVGGHHACPMHSQVAASFAATCPKCGMRLVTSQSEGDEEMLYACSMHPEVRASWDARCPRCGMTLVSSGVMPDTGHLDTAPHTADTHLRSDSIEWEDDMVAINRQTNAENMVWQLIDRETDAKNNEISWTFTVGDRVKIRLVNEMGSDHPMPHPLHIHGAGRFVVLSRDGTTEPNLMWKDTVLVLAGETVDILLDVTNPGRWMAHCHITEHNQNGMMFSFEVLPRAEGHLSTEAL